MTMSVIGVLCAPGIPESVAMLRDFTRHKLGKDHERLEDVLVCVSELATNGYEHTDSGRSGGRLTLILAEHDGVVRVELMDDGCARTVPRIRDQPDDCLDRVDGRGLILVHALSSRWGVVGTTTWCEFDPA